MKKEIAAAVLVGSTIGGGGYHLFHKGGLYNPHVIEITEQVLAETATNDMRYCTFKPKAPFDISKGDFLSLFLPRNKEVKFKVTEPARVEQVYVKCNNVEIDTSKLALSLEDRNSLAEVCSIDSIDCISSEVPDAKTYINKLAKKKG